MNAQPKDIRAAYRRPLEGKVAIVTGASSGIGAGIARRLAADGAQVIVNFNRDESGAQAVIDAAIASGGQAHAIKADVSRAVDVERLWSEALARFGKPDIVVSNAGKGTLQPLTDANDAVFDEIYAINVKGVLFNLKQAALNLSDGGRVINIASSTAVFPWPGAAIYASSKAAVLKLTDIAAMELKDSDITVNAVIPGITETPMTRGLPKEATDPVAALSLGKRLGRPDDIAAVVAFLAGPDAAWVTGQHILANGGSGH